MLEQLFSSDSAYRRHRDAPFADERDATFGIVESRVRHAPHCV